MLSNKKSQGLSLNMVVIGVIALIVLVVIVLIFLSPWSSWHKTIRSSLPLCKNARPNNICQWQNDKCNNNNQIEIYNVKDSFQHQNQYCCCLKTK